MNPDNRVVIWNDAVG